MVWTCTICYTGGDKPRSELSSWWTSTLTGILDELSLITPCNYKCRSTKRNFWLVSPLFLSPWSPLFHLSFSWHNFDFKSKGLLCILKCSLLQWSHGQGHRNISCTPHQHHHLPSWLHFLIKYRLWIDF